MEVRITVGDEFRRQFKRLLRIPVDTRSPIPVISVQSVGNLQYQRLSDGSWAAKHWQALFECIVIGASSLRER